MLWFFSVNYVINSAVQPVVKLSPTLSLSNAINKVLTAVATCCLMISRWLWLFLATCLGLSFWVSSIESEEDSFVTYFLMPLNFESSRLKLSFAAVSFLISDLCIESHLFLHSNSLFFLYRSPFYECMMSFKKLNNASLSWRTAYALARVSLWCLFPSLLRTPGNKHQNNPLVGV